MHQKTCAVLLVVLALGVAGCPNAPNTASFLSFDHDGLTRTYRIYVPGSWDRQAPAPLILALHGANTTSLQMMTMTGFNAIAEREQFVVVYPDGISLQWNDGRGGSAFGGGDVRQVDDVGFIRSLIDHVAGQFPIDPGRVYVVGSSNGGMMTHRLAIELTDRFAAAATVVGAMPAPLAGHTHPSGPLSMLIMNGSADPLVPWTGGYIAGVPQWGEILSVEGTVQFWVEHNRCAGQPALSWEPDWDPLDGIRVWRARYHSGDAGSEVIVFGIEGGGHTWPGSPFAEVPSAPGPRINDIDASEQIWQFFSAHSRGAG